MDTTHEDFAAQPCSYIYPIYSVVKNRLRLQLSCIATHPEVRLRLAQVSISGLPNGIRTFKLEQFSTIYLRLRDGGADRDRTDDILLAKQALSQLSYSPI